MRFTFGLSLLLLVAFQSSCSSPGAGNKHKAVLSPRAVPPTSDGFSAAELENAGKLFRAKCLRCHGFYDPASYTDPDWQTWMDKMSRKAKLKPEQREILSRYLGCFRPSTGAQERLPNSHP